MLSAWPSLRCSLALLNSLQRAPCRVDNGFGRETELAIQSLVIGGRAVVLDGDAFPRVAHEAVPRLRDAGLDGHPGTDRRRDDLVAVRLVLRVEPLHTRHRDHT